MEINKPKPIFEKSTFKIKLNSPKNENKNQIKPESNLNKQSLQETSYNNSDMASPAPSYIYQKNSKKMNKNKFYEMFEIEYEKEYFRLFFYINEEDNLVIELIPKDGTIPFSYKNNFDEEKFYKLNKIFMELKTIDKIGEKIINLFKKEKVLFGKNKKKDIFYLILKITIIDEDVDIFIPLNKNENIQLCTINYLLKESEKLKNAFNVYKNETEELLKNQNDEINELKKINSLYSKIISKIKNEYKKENKIENNDDVNEIIINKMNKNEKDENLYEDEEELKKLDEIIIDENEEYRNIQKKIEIIENELEILNCNYKCEFNSKYKIINLTINQTKPYIYIYFELSNIGLYPLISTSDDIFCNLEGFSENSISFYNEQEKYIFLSEPLLPNQKIIISKKLIIKNPVINRKYDFLLNIDSLNNGKITEEPIIFNIFIREKENQNNFLSFLKNAKINLKHKNKKKKIILEYASISYENAENNLKLIDKNEFKKKNQIKLKKFIYDKKSGMALKDKISDLKIIKDKKELNNNDLSEINILINEEEIQKLIKKIKNKYKNLDIFDKEKLEEIICSCLGDYSTICDFIEKMV